MSTVRIVINGTTQVREEDIAEFIRSTNIAAAATVQEPGCVYYYTGQDLARHDVFRLSEGWSDQASLDAHLNSPHFVLAMQEMAAITIISVRLTRFNVTDETDLSDLVPVG